MEGETAVGDERGMGGWGWTYIHTRGCGTSGLAGVDERLMDTCVREDTALGRAAP